MRTPAPGRSRAPAPGRSRGKTPLSRDLVAEVLVLRARGLSIRQIATALYYQDRLISRSSVGEIVAEHAPPALHEPPPENCPRCGSPLPPSGVCRACRREDLDGLVRASDARIAGTVPRDNPLAYDLRGEPAERLAELQRQRGRAIDAQNHPCATARGGQPLS